ncbi:nuclease-related domain-containing protein [Bacillus sp. FJAT-27251]|uniref:nuclease-related domain-containing protein n=1 Tax=Bacillus sp. FJAT-27251 TaxID=1684142 RepID=UPI0006A7D3CF|nr:nuclease-related domain-containing protein [Bacillus sp. FJAT-27251]
MFLNPRTVSDELEILRHLNVRMTLPPKETQSLIRLEKGFQGELVFDQWLTNLKVEVIILSDLLFEAQKTKFQIDSLAITQDRLYLSEVKNFEGDYLYDTENDRFFICSGKEITNPLHQLQRCDTLLRQLLGNLGFQFQIVSQLAFVNPEFSLYQLPRDLPIVLPTQLNGFIRKINGTPSNLHRRHKVLADQLLSNNIKESPYPKLFKYEYGRLRKGICCKACKSFKLVVKGSVLVCSKCSCKERVDEAIVRSTYEYKLLFPTEKLTAKTIKEWCAIIESDWIIRRTLKETFMAKGNGQWTYYE